MKLAYKRIGCATALICAAFIVYAGFAIKRAVNELLAAESRGHAYRVFFLVLEEHTEHTGMFPGSIREFSMQSSLMYSGEYEWSTDSAYILDLIKPDFSILPEIDNLSQFVPDYKERAGWGDVHCESFWGQVVENCRLKESP